jgi:hypothetical protein
MDTMVIITAILMVFTKALDAITTARRIRHIGQEANPLARVLMGRIGIRSAIWLVSLLALVIIVLSVVLLYKWFDDPWYKSMFILVGIGISFVQAAVAESNHKGRTNAVSRSLLKWMRRRT